MKALRICVEVDPLLLIDLEPECADVLSVGLLVSSAYRGVRIEGPCFLPVVATSMSHAVGALHDHAEMCERLAATAGRSVLSAPYEPWLRDCAAFYRLVAEVLVQRRDRLWPS